MRLSKLARRHFFMPDKGGESGAGSAPAPTESAAAAPAAPAEETKDLDYFDGGEMLRGATGGPPEPVAGPAEWTPELAEDESFVPGEPPPAKPGEKAAPVEGEAKPGEAEGEKKPEPAAEDPRKDWPEAARTEVAKIEQERDALKQEKETLAAEVGTLKQSGAGPAVALTPENPLAHIADERGLAANQNFANQVRSWALRNLANGGELPKQLQATMDGVKESEITEARSLSAAEAADLLEAADRIIQTHIPSRRQYLAEERENTEILKQNYPHYLDPKTPEGHMFEAFLQQFPQIKSIPRWRGALAACVRGELAFREEARAKKEAAEKKNGAPKIDPKPAPIPPGQSAGTGSPKISKPQKQSELRASMDADELAEVM